MTGKLLGQVSLCCHRLLRARAQALPLAPSFQGPQAPAQRRLSTLSSSKSRSFEAAGAMASEVASNTGESGAQIIDGKAIAQTIREEIKVKVAKLHEATGKRPGLAVVLVGSRGDSETYVRSKRKACEELGIASFDADVPEDISEEDLLKVVQDFNSDDTVHGILVQLPLPKHIDAERVLDAIGIHKDIDGFHPANIGSLAMRGRNPLFAPCTPKGCLELLDRSGVQIAGRRAVVIGRSNIVGTPAALLLQRRDATVTVVHSRTPNPAAVVQQADIIIAAVGVPEMVTRSWVKRGAAVIDVGTNAVDDASKKRGYRLVGDVAYKEVKEVAGWITPVPGGVGPMTIAMLMQNCLLAASRALLGPSDPLQTGIETSHAQLQGTDPPGPAGLHKAPG